MFIVSVIDSSHQFVLRKRRLLDSAWLSVRHNVGGACSAGAGGRPPTHGLRTHEYYGGDFCNKTNGEIKQETPDKGICVERTQARHEKRAPNSGGPNPGANAVRTSGPGQGGTVASLVPRRKEDLDVCKKWTYPRGPITGLSFPPRHRPTAALFSTKISGGEQVDRRVLENRLWKRTQNYFRSRFDGLSSARGGVAAVWQALLSSR
ncbi:unnamed protein product [Lampetra fluviatilis]